ncbi:MAG: hypothetical protein QNK37_21150 [Acidobacteriota bacterium]|nr:hypothetical protein [Acidobacteriota bacterium]
MRPLVFLVADKNMEFALRGFFSRPRWHQILQCAHFAFEESDIKVAVGQNDPGLFARANELLQPFQRQYKHAVVMIDEEWEGSPGSEAIRKRLTEHLEDAGWSSENSLGLVLEPEVDIWLWSDSPHSAEAMGWNNWNELSEALEAGNWLEQGAKKPHRPKEAAEWALRKKHIPRSSALYRKIAGAISVKRCRDEALLNLIEALQRWFPPA